MGAIAERGVGVMSLGVPAETFERVSGLYVDVERSDLPEWPGGGTKMESLGTKQKPATVRVHSRELAEALLVYCRSRDWMLIAGVEPDKTEDISDLRRLCERYPWIDALGRVGKEEPCPCGSGKRFKKCCRDHPNRLKSRLDRGEMRPCVRTLREVLESTRER